MSQNTKTVAEEHAVKDSGLRVAIVGLMLGALLGAGGVFFAGGLTAEPPVDLRAEYCRGIADGEVKMYNDARNFVIGLEERATAAGVDIFVVAVRDGVIIEQEVASVTLFEPMPDDYGPMVESVCNKMAVEKFDEFGIRGPSDLVTTTTAP